jgi:sugar lactone lactonase YvrE
MLDKVNRRALMGAMILFLTALLIGSLPSVLTTAALVHLPAQQHGETYVFVLKWGSEGSGDGQFNRSEGVTVDSSGYVYVADRWNNRIQRFTSNGDFITKWGRNGSGDGEFYCPTGVAVDASGFVYVAAPYNYRIQKFTSSGSFITKWGSEGSSDGQFRDPEGVAVDSSGYVYVADTHNHRIQKFTSNGAFITKWGSEGSGDGQFRYPEGVAVDSIGYVYVADSGNHRIQKFTSNGDFTTQWGSFGSSDGQFRDPDGVAVDSSGYVYVADTFNHRIQKFKREEGPTPTFTPTSTRTRTPTATWTPTSTPTSTPTPAGPCADYDGDGLCNDWEGFGYNGVDLPAMGADPNHKDIFVEIDYMVDPGFCKLGVCVLGHSHKPKPEAIAKVVEAFRNAPVSNPDGIHGINLHVDFGPETPMKLVQGTEVTWGSLSRSNALLHDDDLSWTEFYTLKENPVNFDPARRHIFHYAIFAHFLDGKRCTSGEGYMPGVDFIVSLGGWGPRVGAEGCDVPFRRLFVGGVDQQAGTFMHELGHNLGLHHGGGNGINYKPNYLSVMNYAFQTRGLIYGGQDGTFDYSRSDKIPSLDESNLNETVGLNGGSSTSSYGTRWYCGTSDKVGEWTNSANGPIDWNCNDNCNETNVQADINRSGSSSETLFGYFDWANLDYGGGGAIGTSAGQAVHVASTLPEELTFDEDRHLFTPYQVFVSGPGELQAVPGTTTIYNFMVTNSGHNPDVYILNASSSRGWADLGGVPGSVTLGPGASRDIPIRVVVPPYAEEGAADEIRLVATSQNSPRIVDVAYAHTRTLVRVYLPLLLKNYTPGPQPPVTRTPTHTPMSGQTSTPTRTSTPTGSPTPTVTPTGPPLIPGPPYAVTLVADPTSLTVGDTSTLIATVKDQYDNAVADGTEVIFVTSLGILGSDTIVKTTTSGVAIATLTSETIAGTAVITATADSKRDTTTVTIIPDPPYTVTVTADPMAIPANGVSTSAVQATVIDQYFNMVADGISCSFHTTLGSVWPPSDTTLNGVAEATLTSSETPGLAAVTAICAGIEGTIYIFFYGCPSS